MTNYSFFQQTANPQRNRIVALMTRFLLIRCWNRLVMRVVLAATFGVFICGSCMLQLVLPTSAVAAVVPQASMKLYWTDIRDDMVYRANLDGTEVEVLFASDPARNADLYDLDVDPFGTLYWVGRDDGLSDSREAIRRSNFDGTDVGVIPIGEPGQTLIPRDVVFNRVSGALYVAGERAGILKVNLDGSDIDRIYTSRGSSGLALDVPARKIYWTEYELDRIMRANLDGTDIEVLFAYPPFSNNDPQDIEIDPGSGWLFWTNPIAGQIVRSNLDGGNVTVLKTVEDGFPQYLDIDHRNKTIYFTNNVAGTIERMGFDGGNHAVVIEGLTHPIGVTLGPAFAIPEPSSLALLVLLGFVGVAFGCNRRRRLALCFGRSAL